MQGKEGCGFGSGGRDEDDRNRFLNNTEKSGLRMEEEEEQNSGKQLCSVTRREEGKTRQASVFHLQRTMGGGD